MKFKDINSTHISYDSQSILKQGLLYRGGKELHENASLFIPKEQNESRSAYTTRLSWSSYKNHLASIINDFCTSLFSSGVECNPSSDASDTSTIGDQVQSEFYKLFSENADLKGNNFEQVMAHTFSDSLVWGQAFIGIDFKRTEEEVITLIEENELQYNRAYLYDIDPQSIINWKTDKFSNYEWIILKDVSIEQSTWQSPVVNKTYTFMVWYMEDGFAKYKKFAITKPINKEPQEQEDIPLIDEGYTSFTCIPVIKLCIPDNLAIGPLIEDQIVNIYRRHSSLIFAMNRSANALPYYKQGAEITSDGEIAEAGQNPNRGQKNMESMKSRGFLVMGPQDEVGFLEPEGKCFELIDKQLKEDVDTLHQITNTLANTIASATKNMKESGLSKSFDDDLKSKVLSAYGNIVKNFVKKIWSTISNARGENIIWNVSGMDDFRKEDKTVILQEAQSISNINIPSKTANKIHMKKVTFELLAGAITEAEKKQVSEEIDAFFDRTPDPIDDELDERTKKDELHQASLQPKETQLT